MVEWVISQYIFEDTLILNSGERIAKELLKQVLIFQRYSYHVNPNEIKQLLDTYYTIHQKEMSIILF